MVRQQTSAVPPRPTVPSGASGTQQRVGSNRANIRCHRCHDLGHYANECPKACTQLLMEEEQEVEFPEDEEFEDKMYMIDPDHI